MTDAFVYRWKNLDNDMSYIGYHKGSLDDGYICSSIPMKEHYDKNPEYFIRSIIDYGTTDEMKELESFILSELDAMHNDTFYNQTNGCGGFYCRKHSKKSRKKMSESRRGNTNTLGYKYPEGSQDWRKESMMGNNRARKQACLVNGNKYESVSDASRKEGIARLTIQRNIKRNTKGFKYL